MQGIVRAGVLGCAAAAAVAAELPPGGTLVFSMKPDAAVWPGIRHERGSIDATGAVWRTTSLVRADSCADSWSVEFGWAVKFRGVEPSWEAERKQGQSLYSFFRVRSGGGGGARYGKLSPFGLNGYELGVVRVAFTLHLNPDGTRNLEFDPRRNLASGEASKVQALP